jgi:hypothetical protein
VAPVAAARQRCPWAKDPRDIRYHDEEWGVPVHDDRTLFEFLILEGRLRCPRRRLRARAYGRRDAGRPSP